jgi:hypothetical protein
MMKISRLAFPVAALAGLIITALSCSKSNTNSSAITKENIAGSYTLTALTASVAGLPAQSIIDSIPACQRDDVYKLNLDYTMNYIDAGTKCVPPGDSVSSWNLSGNTIWIGSDSASIQSFDGKKLVMSSTVTILGVAATTSETFTKQ